MRSHDGTVAREIHAKSGLKNTAVSMVSHRGHNCIFSALTILDSALTS